MRPEHVEFVLLSRKSDTNDGRICRKGAGMIYNKKQEWWYDLQYVERVIVWSTWHIGPPPSVAAPGDAEHWLPGSLSDSLYTACSITFIDHHTSSSHHRFHLRGHPMTPSLTAHVLVSQISVDLIVAIIVINITTMTFRGILITTIHRQLAKQTAD